MNQFVGAVKESSNITRTTNDMVAFKSTLNDCVDLFFKVAASRGQDVTGIFRNAYMENQDIALRIAAWLRDIRGGAGERKLFRDILLWLEGYDKNTCKALAVKIPEIGRWDDLLIFKTQEMKEFAYNLIQGALVDGNGLCAKWMPRQKYPAKELQVFLKLSPKQYRKLLVGLSSTVETQMCAREWDSINFSQVPSVASARYKNAFYRNTPRYAEYVQGLVNNEEGVKVNASAIFPHDVLKGMINWDNNSYSKTAIDLIQKQWEALPDYMGDSNVLPLVDVSGSMGCSVGGNGNLRCIDIAVSLGLYMADKNKGVFKDLFMTFSSHPELMLLSGNIIQKISKMIKSNWDMSTNLERAFKVILQTAQDHKVPSEDMPEKIVIFSDMQFDGCISFDGTAFNMIQKMYDSAGYKIPKIIFWNLNAHDNIPVKFNTQGVALVSGFSPSLLKSLLKGNLEEFTPQSIMMETIMQDRYKVI